ncbi:MAG TPA: DinB family protein [Aggregatilineales bacterium]|nr:DinB family protein [Aggregatilineales bacterium]
MSRRDVLLGALESAPRDLARLCAAAGEDGDEHGAAGVVAAMCEGEAAFRARLGDGAEDEPAAGSLGELAAAFAAERQRTLGLLRGLRPGEWQRPPAGADTGTSVRGLVQQLVDHDTLQLAELARLRSLARSGR